MQARSSNALASLVLLAALVSCRGGGEARPGPEPAAPDRPGPEGEAPPKPTNLLEERERSQLYFNLDQYTRSCMAARTKGDTAAWTSLHANVLAPLVDENLDELLSTLAAREAPRYRLIAARALGFGSDARRIVPALVDVLREKDVLLVNSSLVSLYYLASPDTPLLPLVALLAHPDADIRSNDALALFAVLRKRRVAGRVPLDSEVREASGRLIAAVSDPRDPDVRGHAAAALGEIGDPTATDILVNLLGDESSFVRIRAAAGLGELGQERAVPALIDALGAAEAVNEATVIAAALEKIAKVRGLPCEGDVLGTDAGRWRSWYSAVKSGT